MKPGQKPKPKKKTDTNVVRIVDGKKLEMVEPSGHGDCDFPPHLEESLRQYWDEVIGMAPRGVVSGSDRLIVELAARNIQIMRTNPSEMSCQRSTELRRCLAELGCTPSSRASLGVLKPKAENPFGEFGGMANDG